MRGCTPSLHLLLILEVFRGGCWSHVCILSLAASLGLTLPTASLGQIFTGPSAVHVRKIPHGFSEMPYATAEIFCNTVFG